MYGPPQSDSEDDDYDGFYFGDDYIKKQPRSNWVTDPDQDLYDAVCSGNLDEMVKQVTMLQFHLDEVFKDSLTLLHYACKNAHVEIVQYLLKNNANPNRQVDSVTPLMEICNCQKENSSRSVKEIVELLLRNNAVINVSDKFGMTPFMFACKNGHLEAARILIKYCYLEACDNNGWTSIFHAIESNKIDIVRLLVEAGADINISNRKGYTPRQVAQFHGFYDILNILPAEEYKYTIPTTFLCYSSLRDLIPRIFLRTEVPEYFQEITSILGTVQMEKCLENLAKGEVSLSEFLLMDDEKLLKIGIEMPVHRSKIQIGLLNFHLNYWTKKSIARVKRNESDSFYDILLLSANHLQNLVIINSTIKYLQQNYEAGQLGPLNIQQCNLFKENVQSYKKSLKDLMITSKYLQSFSPPKSPLHIDYDEYLTEKKKNKMRCFVKYTIFIGISIVICLKMKSMM